MGQVLWRSTGQLAAQVAIEAIATGDTTARFLHRYQEAWHWTLARKMQRNYRPRERFPPDRRADERFMRVLALAVAASNRGQQGAAKESKSAFAASSCPFFAWTQGTYASGHRMAPSLHP